MIWTRLAVAALAGLLAAAPDVVDGWTLEKVEADLEIDVVTATSPPVPPAPPLRLPCGHGDGECDENECARGECYDPRPDCGGLPDREVALEWLTD